MQETIKIDMPPKEDATTLEVRTDSDSELLLHLCPTWITDSKGERMGDYVVGMSIHHDTGTEEDGIQFTSLTTTQVEVLVEKLLLLQSKAKILNKIVNE